MNYYVYITKQSHLYVAEVPALPGCRTLGRSEREVLENIKSVVRGYVKTMRKKRHTLPKVKVVKLREQGLEALEPA